MNDHLTDRKIDGSLGKYVLLILECKKDAEKKKFRKKSCDNSHFFPNICTGLHVLI